MKMLYEYRYTTSGGAHRYAITKKEAKITLGELYLRGVVNPPAMLNIEVEFKY